jgi:streptogramin lyase
MSRTSTSLLRRLGQRGAILLTAVCVQQAPAQAQNRTWTTDADFDAGILDRVNHAVVHDQLQLDTSAQSFSILWIANSSRGTLVRIDAVSGAVIGEYRTAPGNHGRNPSRTAIDHAGNVWTGNRSESLNGRGSVVQVGLVLGGTRVSKRADGSIFPDPQGLYLAPPFVHCTAVDRDGDGLIRTSRGLGDVLAWPDVTDGQGGPTGVVHDAADECIRLYQRTTAPAVNHVSMDADDNVWAAGYPAGIFDVLDGDTAGLLRTVTPGCGGGFGGCIDRNGVLWSSNPSQGRLLRYDIATGSATCIPVQLSSGVCVDSDGFVWSSMGANNTIVKVDAQGGIAAGFPRPAFGGGSFGIAVTPSDGDVWIANSTSNTVTRLAGGTTLRKRITVSANPNGLAVDPAGKVWVTCQGANTATRIDPHGGVDHLGVVDLVVPLGTGAGPQTFGGMAALLTVHLLEAQGSWSVAYDGGRPEIAWNTLAWQSEEPAGTRLWTEARVAESMPDLAAAPWAAVANGADLRSQGLRGSWIEMRVHFERGAAPVSPVLRELTVNANQPPDCGDVHPSMTQLWPPDHRMQDIEILGVVDPDGDPIRIVITRVTQDEPLDENGRRRPEPDAVLVGTSSVQLRAERSGREANGRVYEIHYRALDDKGASCSGSVQVCVPHDEGASGDCIDDGQLYVSTGSSLPGSGGLGTLLYPNPFNPTTTISYVLPQPGPVRLAIYDVRGHEVRRLVDAAQEPGEHAILWDGRDTTGASMPSGVYIYRVRSGDLQSMGRMLLVK